MQLDQSESDTSSDILCSSRNHRSLLLLRSPYTPAIPFRSSSSFLSTTGNCRRIGWLTTPSNVARTTGEKETQSGCCTTACAASWTTCRHRASRATDSGRSRQRVSETSATTAKGSWCRNPTSCASSSFELRNWISNSITDETDGRNGEKAECVGRGR